MGTGHFFSRLLPCLLVAGGSLPLAAVAQSSWYLGGSIGQSVIRASPTEIEEGFLLDDSFVASGTTLDKTDRGWKAYAGHRINRFLGVEGGYADLGKASFDTTIVGAPPGTIPAPPFPIHATASVRGITLAALAHLPISQQLSLFVRAGAFHSEAKFTETITGTGLTRVGRSVRRTDANYGLGLDLAFSRTVGARVEWERFKHIGRGIGGREGRDVDFVSAGISVRF